MTDAPTTTELTTEQEFANALLTRAHTLREAREANTADTARNRAMLRGLADTADTLTPEQIAQVNELYPKPKRRAAAAHPETIQTTTPDGNPGVRMPAPDAPTDAPTDAPASKPATDVPVPKPAAAKSAAKPAAR